MAVYLSTQGRESSRSPHHAIIDKSVNETMIRLLRQATLKPAVREDAWWFRKHWK
jgi:hypothetical protein